MFNPIVWTSLRSYLIIPTLNFILGGAETWGNLDIKVAGGGGGKYKIGGT